MSANVAFMGEIVRGSTVPVPPWWFQEVAKFVGRTGKLYKAVDLANRLGITKPRLSKLLNNQTTTLELVDAVSDLLGIPRPVVVLTTPELAQEVHLRIRDLDPAILARAKAAAEAEVANVTASVEKSIAGRQTARARSRDHVGPGTNQGGRGQRRRVV